MGKTRRITVNAEARLKTGGRKIQKLTKNEFIEKANAFIQKVCADNEWVMEKIENTQSNRKILHYLPTAIRQEYHNDDSQIKKDFKGITPDWENYDMVGDLRTIKGAPYIMMQVGGDWECPLCVMVYYDGKQFRCYVPTKGNAFRKDTKQLFGNVDGEYDSEMGEYSDTIKRHGKVIPTDDKYVFDELVKTGVYDKNKDAAKMKGIGNHVWYNPDMCIDDFSARVEIKEAVKINHDNRAVKQGKTRLYETIMKKISNIVITALNESDEKLSEEDKMRMWHDGERKENIKAMSADKLRQAYAICVQKGYDDEARALAVVAKSKNVKLEIN